MNARGPDTGTLSGPPFVANSLQGTRLQIETGFLIVLTLAGLALRAARLDFQPLWWDEGYSVWFATHSLGQMAALTAEDIHPPLYYALLHGWTQFTGMGPVALRLLSTVFGALAIPAIYLAGRRIFGDRRIALLAAALLVINPLHVFYSQEIRMYGLVALLSAGVIAATWRFFDTETRRHEDTSSPPASPRPRVSASPPPRVPPSPRPRAPASPRPRVSPSPTSS